VPCLALRAPDAVHPASGVRVFGTLVAFLAIALSARAQGHDMSRMSPADTVGWRWHIDGSLALAYVNEGTKRGATQLGIRDWEMVSATRFAGPGTWAFRFMTTSAPFTLGGNGSPQLLQSGGTYRHAFVHDRTHPVPALMMLDATYRRRFGTTGSASLTLGAVSEPALGPTSYFHRKSAESDIIAPIGHHWQDASHQSFGVVTASAAAGGFMLEASAFNARESDENHDFVDYRDAKLDSYSARLSWHPASAVTMSAWTGYLVEPHRLDATTTMHRYGAAIETRSTSPFGGDWMSLFVFGENVHHHGPQSHHLLHAAPGSPPYMKSKSALAESTLELGERMTVFGRAEYAEKNGEELGFLGGDLMVGYPVKSLALGATRELAWYRSYALEAGARGTINLVPESLRATYGTTRPSGFAVYLRLRPARVRPTL
jgi:hypothetical protein